MTARTDNKRKADADAAKHSSKSTKLSTSNHAKTTPSRSTIHAKGDATYEDSEKDREENGEDSSAESTTDGPRLENSKGSIWEEQEKTYQVRVSLEHLSDRERFILGIYQWASYVEVRVVLGGPQKKNPLYYGSKIRGFCIHLRPAVPDGGNSSKNKHKNVTMDKGWDTDGMFPACNTRDSSMFTHLLGKALYEEINESPSCSLERILSKASSLIGQPLVGKCVMCNDVFKTPSWGPTTCSTACSTLLSTQPYYQYQISRLLADHDALDFLLCCVFTIVKKGTDLPGCELDNGTVRSTLESFPSLETSKTLPEILGVGKPNKSRRTLLLWLCKTFTGRIMSAPPAAQLPGMPTGTRQILVLNVSNPALEHFHSSVQPKSSAPGFQAADAWSILNILSHGFSDDSAIFRDLTKSLDSGKDPLAAWDNSQFLRSRIVFGVEAEFPAQANTASEQASSAALKGNVIMPRYILAFPEQRGSAWTSGNKAGISWTGREKEIKATMVKTFEAIREGVLSTGAESEDSGVETADAETEPPQVEPENEASEKEDTTSGEGDSTEKEQGEPKDSDKTKDNAAPKPGTTTTTTTTTEPSAKEPAGDCETCSKH